ncbi:hypothetical protein LEP3755_63380 (plasmid) [Leptolyngbya sp. NIES-3755]|nr:hypothetical protein LEP3755_63380 [Leptolyngbya sp. NIES-3755]
MALKRLVLGILAASFGAITGLLFMNMIQPQSWRPSNYSDPYLHSPGRTAK